MNTLLCSLRPRNKNCWYTLLPVSSFHSSQPLEATLAAFRTSATLLLDTTSRHDVASREPLDLKLEYSLRFVLLWHWQRLLPPHIQLQGGEEFLHGGAGREQRGIPQVVLEESNIRHGPKNLRSQFCAILVVNWNSVSDTQN